MVLFKMDIVINAEIAERPENGMPISCQGNYYHHILACLGDSNDVPPVADVLRRYHDLDGQWLIVSPVHWQATHNDAMIVATGHELQLSEEESRLWFTALSEFMAFDHIHLHYHDAYTWLLQSDGKPPITARTLHALRHQSMMPEIQTLDSTLFWPRLITETQMLFSSHPLNKSRTEKYQINGVWIWGSTLKHTVRSKPLVCHDGRLIKLAKLLSTDVKAYPSLASLSKNSVLLCSEINEDEHALLQTRFQNETVHWYWNNMAYQSKPKSLWSRLRGRFELLC